MIAFNGKLAFEQFAQRKCKFGLQKELLYGARVYVLPETNTQDEKGNSERVRHFRKLAQLVSRTETETREPKGKLGSVTMSEADRNRPSNRNVQLTLILESKQDGIATLTLNRPDKLNAINKDLAMALNESLGRFTTDKSIYVVIITGAGRAFCAGGDLDCHRRRPKE